MSKRSRSPSPVTQDLDLVEPWSDIDSPPATYDDDQIAQFPVYGETDSTEEVSEDSEEQLDRYMCSVALNPEYCDPFDVFHRLNPSRLNDNIYTFWRSARNQTADNIIGYSQSLGAVPTIIPAPVGIPKSEVDKDSWCVSQGGTARVFSLVMLRLLILFTGNPFINDWILSWMDPQLLLSLLQNDHFYYWRQYLYGKSFSRQFCYFSPFHYMLGTWQYLFYTHQNHSPYVGEDLQEGRSFFYFQVKTACQRILEERNITNFESIQTFKNPWHYAHCGRNGYPQLCDIFNPLGNLITINLAEFWYLLAHEAKYLCPSMYDRTFFMFQFSTDLLNGSNFSTLDLRYQEARRNTRKHVTRSYGYSFFEPDHNHQLYTHPPKKAKLDLNVPVIDLTQ